MILAQLAVKKGISDIITASKAEMRSEFHLGAIKAWAMDKFICHGLLRGVDTYIIGRA
ncbi:MAG: hypothetical protein J5476_08465 [Lachnospiraceae bacterium]|nr:hypothetical protein [Lachnospiraceae bacterium]